MHEVRGVVLIRRARPSPVHVFQTPPRHPRNRAFPQEWDCISCGLNAAPQQKGRLPADWVGMTGENWRLRFRLVRTSIGICPSLLPERLWAMRTLFSVQFSILILAFIVLPVARADEWPSPTIREAFNHSRTCFVRVLPGKSLGDVVGFSGATRGPWATAEFYRLEKDRSYRLAATASLLNPIAPIDFFVTDRGFLVTLDNWHNMGYGKVVAFYSPDGKPIRTYELSDLFDRSEIDSFTQSVSSIWWRKSVGAYIRQGDDSFYVTVNDTGAGFVFDLSGAYQFCESRQGRTLCRTANRDRIWRAYREPVVSAR